VAFYADGADSVQSSLGFLRASLPDYPAPLLACGVDLLQHKRTGVWIGTHSVSSMHFDNVDNFFAQVRGRDSF
jgi:hypothetical protein